MLIGDAQHVGDDQYKFLDQPQAFWKWSVVEKANPVWIKKIRCFLDLQTIWILRSPVKDFSSELMTYAVECFRFIVDKFPLKYLNLETKTLLSKVTHQSFLETYVLYSDIVMRINVFRLNFDIDFLIQVYTLLFVMLSFKHLLKFFF